MMSRGTESLIAGRRCFLSPRRRMSSSAPRPGVVQRDRDRDGALAAAACQCHGDEVSGKTRVDNGGQPNRGIDRGAVGKASPGRRSARRMVRRSR